MSISKLFSRRLPQFFVLSIAIASMSGCDSDGAEAGGGSEGEEAAGEGTEGDAEEDSAGAEEEAGEEGDDELLPPSALEAEAVDNGIQLKWQDNSSNEFHFMLQRKQGDGDFVQHISTTKPDVAMILDDVDVEDGVTYTYRVQAMDPKGKLSSFSNEATATAMLVDDSGEGEGSEDGETEVAAPSNLEVHPLEGKFHVMWKDNSDNELHFMVQRRAGEEDFDWYFTTEKADETEFMDEEIESGVEYAYRVAAMAPDGTISEFSNEVTATAG